MDVELCHLITRLNAYILTHPNIVNLWKHYLYKKVEQLNDSNNLNIDTHNALLYIIFQVDNLNKSISKCNIAIELMAHMSDFTTETLLLLLTLQSNIT